MMENDSIFEQRDGERVTLTLNRPDKLNAMTLPMWQSLGEHVVRLSEDLTVRVITLRGAGERAFSPGNDISEFSTHRSNAAQAAVYGKSMHETARILDACPHPLIAQIHGICVGGGLEIAALCDLRIAGRSSRFGAPIKNLGLVMAYAEMAPLIRLIGESATLAMLLEGRIIDATEALSLGLVTRVVDDGMVEQEALETAKRIAQGAPLVARWHKKFARRLRQSDAINGSELSECFECFDTADFKEGYSAFLAKRSPQFQGR